MDMEDEEADQLCMWRVRTGRGLADDVEGEGADMGNSCGHRR